MSDPVSRLNAALEGRYAIDTVHICERLDRDLAATYCGAATSMQQAGLDRRVGSQEGIKLT